MRLFASAVAVFVLATTSFAAEGESRQRKELRLGGRAPASASPLALPMVGPPSAPAQSPRWRLMRTCRNDVGTQQSLSGIGYGNCLRD